MTPEQLLQGLIDAERSAQPPAEAGSAGWQKLVTADLSKALVPAATGAPLGAGVWVGLLKGVAVGLGLGAASLGGASAAGWLDNPPSSAVVHSAPAAARSAQLAVSGSVPVQSPPATATDVAEVNAPSVAVAPSSTGAPSSAGAVNAGVVDAGAVDAGDLDAETVLLRRAKAALDAGRVAVAEVWLQEHASRFPAGSLSVEREGLKIVVACVEGQPDAQQRAVQFLSQHPGSLLAPRIQRKCPGVASKGALPEP